MAKFEYMQRAFSSELKPRARLVLQVLVLHCNKEGECFPSIKTILTFNDGNMANNCSYATTCLVNDITFLYLCKNIVRTIVRRLGKFGICLSDIIIPLTTSATGRILS